MEGLIRVERDGTGPGTVVVAVEERGEVSGDPNPGHRERFVADGCALQDNVGIIENRAAGGAAERGRAFRLH